MVKAAYPPALVCNAAKLTNSRLKELLLVLGEPQSGTKMLLLQNLCDGLCTPKVKQLPGRATRILSIDMGIRNLAFCVLDADVGGYRDTSVPQTLANPENHQLYQNIPHVCKRVSVVAWKRLSLLDAFRAAAASRNPTVNAQLPIQGDAQANTGRLRSAQQKSRKKSRDATEAAPTARQDDAEPTDQKVDYSPAVMAQVAYKLVSEIFLPLHISHVVIEKQRHRSGGASAVLEWTIRVNRLESMLHAIFETLRRTTGSENIKDAFRDSVEVTSHSQHEHGSSGSVPLSVTSVDPKAVNRLWLETSLAQETNLAFDDKGPSGSDTKSVSTSAGLKRQKIGIAERLIAGNSGLKELVFSEQAAPARRRFLGTSDTVEARGKAKKAIAKSGPEDKKRDDLADSLLQGLAWVQWELSRRTLAPLLLEGRSEEDQQTVQGSRFSAARNLPELWPKSET